MSCPIFLFKKIRVEGVKILEQIGLAKTEFVEFRSSDYLLWNPEFHAPESASHDHSYLKQQEIS